MTFSPLDALGNFILGWIKNGQLQTWVRLFVSIFGTAFVTFFGIFGLSVPLLYVDFGPVGALVIGLATGCLAMSTAVLFLWRQSPLTKKIPIVVPGKIEAELEKVLIEQNMVMSGGDRK